MKTRYTKDEYRKPLAAHVALLWETTEDKGSLLANKFCVQAIQEQIWTPPGKPGA